jgi:hypothetical protein
MGKSGGPAGGVWPQAARSGRRSSGNERGKAQALYTATASGDGNGSDEERAGAGDGARGGARSPPRAHLDRINRRTHLRLGLFLLTWLFMCGVTAILFTRHERFDGWYHDGVPEWTERSSRAYPLGATTGSDPRTAAARILEDSGMGEQRFWAGWQDDGELAVH